MKEILILLAMCACAPTLRAQVRPPAEQEFISRFQVRAVNPDTLMLLHHQVQVKINRVGVEIIPPAGCRDFFPQQYTGLAWVLRGGIFYAQLGDTALTWNPGVVQPYVEVSTPDLVVTYYAGLPVRLVLQEGPEN